MLIQKFSEKTGLTVDTLRYYEKEGLLNPKRNKQNYRIYSEEDYCWILLLLKMKTTNMSMKQIKYFASLQKKGESTIIERNQILEEHLKNLEKQKQELNDTIDFVIKKIQMHKK